MAKFAKLEWDVIFSGDLLGSYKPNARMYNDACSLLGYPSVEQHAKVGMVASHIYDLQAASKYGMKTIYVPRDTEDTTVDKSLIKTKSEGGEVDVIVKDLGELATLLGAS